MVWRLWLWRAVFFTTGSRATDSRIGAEDRSGTWLARQVARRAAGHGGWRRTSRGYLRNNRCVSWLHDCPLRRVLSISESAVAGARDDRRRRRTDRAARRNRLARRIPRTRD